MLEHSRDSRQKAAEELAAGHAAVEDSRAAGVIRSPLEKLHRLTDARNALGGSGVSTPARALFDFQAAHAEAIDAVRVRLDVDALQQRLAELAHAIVKDDALRLHSQARDRLTYLQQPDLGRLLDDDSRERLAAWIDTPQAAFDLALVIVDGLSSRAAQDNAAPFIDSFCARLNDGADEPFSLAPVSIVEQGRVAIGDSIGELLNARCVLVLIGERPGLNSPDSLGLYLTWSPRTGLHDSRRNCISNIRPAGLAYDEAAERAVYLLRRARKLNTSGVTLKDRRRSMLIGTDSEPQNFLVRQATRSESTA